jgi:hypothetical protein
MGDVVGRLFHEFAVTLACGNRNFIGGVTYIDANDVRMLLKNATFQFKQSLESRPNYSAIR